MFLNNFSVNSFELHAFIVCLIFTYILLFIERQQKRSNYFVLGPSVRRDLSVIESYTT